MIFAKLGVRNRRELRAEMITGDWRRTLERIGAFIEANGHSRVPQGYHVIRPIFNAESGEQARELLGDALQRLERPLPKVAALLERAEEDPLAFYAFPVDHWRKLRSTNPSSGSIARLVAAPTSSASSPMTPR